MNKFPELQPARVCVLRTNPEVNKSKGVGVRTALHQMVNFLTFCSELALRLTHPLIVGEKKKSETALMQGTMQVPQNSWSFLHNGDKAGFNFSMLNDIT